jgi:UDP-N-acetylglucosamine/UDP-N-acetylgalactosamine diphosphorylase
MTDSSVLRTMLAEHGQEHVLRFWDRLDDGQRQGLLEQIAGLDLNAVDRMANLLRNPPDAGGERDVRPADVLELDATMREAARAPGEAALRAGRVGVLLVAGGQGSRLGYDGPKGCYPIGPVSRVPLFAVHARKILALERTYASAVPFYIMTSRLNDAPTRAFFETNAFYGLDRERVRFFSQGMWPALDADGRLVLENPARLFLSPDGHGGILSALEANGLLADMARRGIDTLFYFQVDNPLVEIADPVFIGAHCDAGADVSVKVCAKRDPDEGLGVITRVNGRPAVVEYTELTDAQKRERLPDGRLRFLYGSVAIHVFTFAFLKRMAEADLPLHLAHKKVPMCDASGATVKPDTPNAYKFEKFIFDVLPMADRTLNLAFLREDEFSPVKNAEGDDSPAMAKRDMTLKFARWLEAAGVDVPRGADGVPLYPIEIDPLFALNPGQLASRVDPSLRITGPLVLA